MPAPPRLLLLLPRSSYRAEPFLTAARGLGADVVVGSDHTPALPSGGFVELSFARPNASLERIGDLHRQRPLDGVFGTDEATSYLAALAAEALGLAGNPPDALAVLHDKLAFRRWLRAEGLPGPHHLKVALDGRPIRAPAGGYPWVLKPRALSASRGVIRADTPAGFRDAAARIRALLESLARPGRWRELDASALAESYLAGSEVALEGVLVDGRLEVLALFDKPDTPAGPTFAETLYVTPSRLPPPLQARCRDAVQTLADRLGLRRGPVHAELRVGAGGVSLVEAAARPIGGQCAEVLRMADGASHEMLLLRQALGYAPGTTAREGSAVGIMMLPVERAGVLRTVDGVAATSAVRHVVDVAITVAPGTVVQPLPDGEPYLGFVFARAPTPDQVEDALRTARARLRPVVEA